MIFQQAMAAGKPVVSTRTSGIPDIVSDGHSGLLVDPGNSQALAEALRLLLRSSELRYQMGAWGKKEAERRFRPEVVARQTYDIYLSLLSSN
jgi:glycosyltransferase involved in cell wall biosynthesis